MGRPDVGGLLREMGGARNLIEWQEYAALEPFGTPAEDLRFARLAALVLNRLRFSEDTKAVTVDDLLPDLDGSAERRRREAEESRQACLKAGRQAMTSEEWREWRRRRKGGG